jgi:hypothetical protein
MSTKERIITVFANQIACGVLIVLLVTVVACSGKKDSGSGTQTQVTSARQDTGYDSGQPPVAAQVKQGDFGYIRNQSNDGIIITYMTVTAQTVVLPDSIEDLPVVGFRTGLFRGDKTLRSITLPATITAIPDEGFRECTSLSGLTLPGVTTIGSNAFRGCSSLVNVTLPVVTTIGNYAFYECDSLVKVSLPEGLTMIGYSAFQNCINLNDLTVPASLTQFPRQPYYNDDTFSGCHKLPLAVRDKLVAQGYSGRGF